MKPALSLFSHTPIIIVFGNGPVAALLVGRIVRTAQERLIPAFLDNQIPVLARVTFDNRQVAAPQVIGHEITDFRFVGANPQPQPIRLLITQLHGITANRTMFDLSPIPHLVIQCAIHRHSRKVTHDFQNELGRTLPGRDDIHPVLGPRQGHIKRRRSSAYSIERSSFTTYLNTGSSCTWEGKPYNSLRALTRMT